MLLKRIGFYLIGLSIGTIGVYFFWQKKNASFDYGMDARTLKTLRVRKRLYSTQAEKIMYKRQIDSLNIETILYNGDVDFSKSNARQKPCAEYFITGKQELKKVSLVVKRCDSTTTIENIIIN